MKWATLGKDLDRGAAAAEAQNHGAMFSTSLKIGRECGSIPPEAMRAGGFVSHKK